MVTERRKHPRISKFVEATWSGRSGASLCRISDISWAGCFIESRAEPQVGEETTIRFSVDDVPITLRATVRNVQRPIGFAVEFEELTPAQVEILKRILGTDGPQKAVTPGS